jgi:hypothetical protein
VGGGSAATTTLDCLPYCGLITAKVSTCRKIGIRDATPTTATSKADLPSHSPCLGRSLSENERMDAHRKGGYPAGPSWPTPPRSRSQAGRIALALAYVEGLAITRVDEPVDVGLERRAYASGKALMSCIRAETVVEVADGPGQVGPPGHGIAVASVADASAPCGLIAAKVHTCARLASVS